VSDPGDRIATGIGDARSGDPVADFDLSVEVLAVLDSLETGVRGGPEPEDVTREAFGREIPEA